MKKNAIMLADTRVALVGTVLLQLQKTNPGLFDEAIIYYLDPISSKDQKLMSKIMPCRFLPYVLSLPPEVMKLPRFQRFSKLMFCRYEMFSFLKEFETVTWLDTDILIQGDLSPMIESAKKTGAVMIREDPANKTAENPDYMRTCFTRAVPEYQMDQYLYCSGTIVLSQKMLEAANCTQWCYEKTVQWANILSLPDQGVLNAAVQEFGINVTPISGKSYCCYPYLGRDCSKAKIVHAWGSNKFWNDWYVYLNFPGWKEYYRQWCNLGGTALPFEIQPKISVLIPSYKPNLQWMKECLDSLMNQNRMGWERFSDFEIIIVTEPFETEGMQKLVKEYRDLRIRLEINECRLGIAASLNRGMRMAKGKYIARVDNDDCCAPERLFMQMEYLEGHPEIALCTSDFEYFGDMNEWRLSFEGDMSFAWSIFTCPFDHPTVMFRKDFFLQNDLFYDENRGFVEDWELWRRAFEKGMRVGSIHKVLFYHRWMNTGSAGQTSKTVDMMRELVQKNFQALDIYIPTEDLPLIAPWNGRLMDETGIQKLEGYFTRALESNRKKRIYDQASLERAFELRMGEARTGQLQDLRKPIQRQSEQREEDSGDNVLPVYNQKKVPFLRRLFKRILKPLYRPFRHRYEDRIIEIQKSGWAVEGHVLNCIAKLDQIIAVHQQQIEQMRQELIQTRTQMEALLSKQTVEIQEQLSAKIFVEVENIRQELSAKLFTEAENTRQELSAKLFTEAENTRQELSAKLFTEAENTRQELAAKLFTEAENTRQELAAKLFTEAENTRAFTENRIWKTECDLSGKISEIDQTKRLLDETHRHIDFTYHDLMVALQRQRGFLPENKIKLETDYPIAYESLDHLYPHGTIQDNTRYPRFVKKCETLLASRKELAFLDLGCSGGGMVLEAALRGHISMGLEGSDCSKREQRAEWRLLGDRLQTCDITKPFYLRDVYEKTQQFDVITAWEVLEHIAETDLPGLFDNIRNHLADDGIFVGSIANWDDIDPESGVNWHVTVHPYDWWKAKFEAAGFFVCTELFDVIDLARGGYNPPHCYEAPYPDVDTQKSFHIAVRKTDA